MAPALDAVLATPVTDTLTLTTSTAAAADTRIIVCLWWFEPAGTLSTIIGGGLEWNVDFQDEDASDNHLAFASAYAPGGLEVGTVIRAVFTSAIDFGPGMAISSWTGLAPGTSGYVDVTSTPVDNFDQNWATNNLVTTVADTLCLGMSASLGLANSNTATTGTELHDWTGEGTNIIAVQYRIESSTGTYTLAGSWASAPSVQINIGIAYKGGSPPADLSADVIRTYPAQGGGFELTAASGVWTAGPYVQIFAASEVDRDLVILGATWAFADFGITGVDQTREWIIEIGTGAAAAETVQLQWPWTFRMDTAVAHPLRNQFSFFFPEPFYVTSGTRVAVRANNQDSGTQTMEGFKVFYRWVAAVGAAASLIYDPAISRPPLRSL